MRFCLILLNCGVALAQHSHPAAPPSEKPVALLPQLGVYTHKIATSNPEAQKFFNQGLNLLYGFNRYEALRSFRKAAELDPKAAMPLWGLAMTMSPHINMDMDGDVNLKDACEALNHAGKLAASAYERGYIEAAAARCPEEHAEKYIEAMRRLSERNPYDLDAATLYAESIMIPVRWKWWSPDGTPAAHMAEAVQVLESVMRRNPDHPGANHFYIHAVEASPSPERAIPSAQRLMGIVPGAGHLVHMPGHIWLTLGDWETAAAVNERAADVDRDYFSRTGVQSGYVGYYAHNVHFIAYARSMQGRAKQAVDAVDMMQGIVAPIAEAMPEMLDAFMAYSLFVRVRFARWDDVLAMPAPNAKLLATTAYWHWGRALAYHGKKDGAAAQREAAQFEVAKAKVPATWPWGNNKAAGVLTMAGHILQARMSATEKDAIPHWRKAVEIQDTLGYDEPPAWYMPLRESLGGALLRAGEAAAAEQVFREGAKRSPRNGRMLLGLLESLKALHKTEAAEFVQREYEREAAHADVQFRVAEL